MKPNQPNLKMKKIKSVIIVVAENSDISDPENTKWFISGTKLYNSRVGWGCRIHRLHLFKKETLPQRMSCI